MNQKEYYKLKFIHHWNRLHIACLFLLVFGGFVDVHGQASIETKDNTNCQGASNGCEYEGPSILINEISISPSMYDGSLVSGSLFTAMEAEGEWIELYNPNECDSVDISGYMLGSYNSHGGGGGGARGMGYILPLGTVVPPNGFVVIRGKKAPLPNPNAIDIIVTEFDNNLCWTGGATSRFWFQNWGSWFAFYDRNGVPQDAIKWGDPISSDLNQRPCIPQQNFFSDDVSFVSSFNEIPGSSYLGSTSEGFNFVRLPDGGNWSNSQVPEFTSYGSCNQIGECKNAEGSSTCNGEAIITPEFGIGPYSYLWDDDLEQTSQQATKLCPGIYTVKITDAQGIQKEIEVEIEEDYFEIESLTLNQPCEAGKGNAVVHLFFDNPSTERNITYEWEQNVSFDSIASNLEVGTYTVRVDDGGCFHDTSFVIEHSEITVDFSASKTAGCIGEALSFENNSTGVMEGTSSCLWTLPDGTTSHNCEMQYTFNEAGSFPITLEITDENNCKKELTIPNMIQINDYPKIELGNDSLLCENETAALNAPLGYSEYHWAPTDEITTSIQASPIGEYTLTVKDENECESEGKVTLISAPYPSVSLGSDTSFCEGGKITLSIAPENEILWSTGATTTSIEIEEPGIYRVDVTNEHNCSAFDEKIVTVVSYPTQLNINKSDTIGCYGDKKFVSVESDAEFIHWSNGQEGFEGSFEESGTIQVFASNKENGALCSIVDSVELNFYNYPKLNKEDTFNHCFEFDKNKTIRTKTIAANYVWEGTRTNSPYHTVHSEGVYDVEVYDYPNCKLKQSVFVEEKCPLRVFVPNAFTPGSGMNPYFYPVVPNYTHLEFYIYNRWGQLIFKCDDPNEAWDGTYNGKPAQQDVYVWKIFVKGYDKNYRVDQYQAVGTVTLIR